jgi:hypothetical protein
MLDRYIELDRTNSYRNIIIDRTANQNVRWIKYLRSLLGFRPKLYNLFMAKLSDQTLTTTFYLLRQLAEAIEQSCATEWTFFEQYGETPRTIDELEEFQNIRQRLNRSYSRLNTLLLRILEAQPTAADAMIELLAQAIDDGQANLEAANASIREIKQGWNLP